MKTLETPFKSETFGYLDLGNGHIATFSLTKLEEEGIVSLALDKGNERAFAKYFMGLCDDSNPAVAYYRKSQSVIYSAMVNLTDSPATVDLLMFTDNETTEEPRYNSLWIRRGYRLTQRIVEHKYRMTQDVGIIPKAMDLQLSQVFLEEMTFELPSFEVMHSIKFYELPPHYAELTMIEKLIDAILLSQCGETWIYQANCKLHLAEENRTQCGFSKYKIATIVLPDYGNGHCCYLDLIFETPEDAVSIHELQDMFLSKLLIPHGFYIRYDPRHEMGYPVPEGTLYVQKPDDTED